MNKVWKRHDLKLDLKFNLPLGFGPWKWNQASYQCYEVH